MNNIVIDFQVYDSNDPKQIIILDTSIWSFIESKRAVIEIITPGESKPVGYEYIKNGVTILNSVNLGLNCVDCGKTQFYDLPDGIYEITVKGSPDRFCKTRMYLKTTTLQNKLDEILIKNYSDCESCAEQSDDISKILRYKNLIQVAEAFVRKGYKCEAQDIIFKIQDYVKKFKNCKRCPHKV
jgi:hypothetical protein